MRQHCDHPEGNFPLSWNERHGALGFGRSLLVEGLGFALFASAEEFARSCGKLRAPTVMVKPSHRSVPSVSCIMPHYKPRT
jgi:hypothetical protein